MNASRLLDAASRRLHSLARRIWTGRWRSSWLMTVLGVLTISAGCVKHGEDQGELALDNSFKEVMAFDASPAVTGIRSAYYRSPDRYTKWLSFTCSDPTLLMAIRKLDADRPKESGFIYLHGGDSPGDRDGTRPEEPLWWKRPEAPGKMEQVTIGQSQPNQPSVVTDIWIDERNHAVYVRRIEFN
ncbi:MAG: hypothetical protein NTV51_00950 [Verrucomicrobia bacterium]|nr:hypothetical protein [Verrucomicrobiota bacterium]